MGFFSKLHERFEVKREESKLFNGACIMVLSGCSDEQVSADISNIAAFCLPDPVGKAGGACTATLLDILYKSNKESVVEESYVEVLIRMKKMLQKKGYKQIPRLSSTHAIDMSMKFKLLPTDSPGKRRALLIGINYVGIIPGELTGCHNDALNMKQYIMNVHGFSEENITLLLDDGENTEPTKENIMAAYKTIVETSNAGDSLFCHFSGHGVQIPDDNGDEDDGKDEAMVPCDFRKSGLIRDDELFDTLIKPLKAGVRLHCIFDCCHSGTMLDLPYSFEPGEQEMKIDEGFNFRKLFKKIGHTFDGFFEDEN